MIWAANGSVDPLVSGTSIRQVSNGSVGPPCGHSAYVRLCWLHIELHRAGARGGVATIVGPVHDAAASSVKRKRWHH